MATDRLLRLSLLSPAHLGSAWGEAALDRPTQVDAWRGLPFLPASAVKGVLAGRWGDVPDEEGSSNAERERRYGSPDRGRERGRPSPIVVGDGRCLGFPAPTTHGPPCWVVPAEGLAWALDRTGLGDEVKDLLALLRTVEH
ncbi:MAG: RAMP superfamily CRISPR-associated protein, partial [Thermoanaerobaculia bacterium]